MNSNLEPISIWSGFGNVIIWGVVLLALVVFAQLFLEVLWDFINRNEIKRLREGRERFRAVGNMTGMHRNSIIKIVGEPSYISTEYYGSLLTWGEPWHRATCVLIKFDHNGYFINVGTGYIFQPSVYFRT